MINRPRKARKRVDPITGEFSIASNAISSAAFQKRKKVDPITGEPSTASNAISYAAFRHRKKVDPITGELSTASNAISYNAFQKRKKVDPITGEPSTASDAISSAAFQNRKRREQALKQTDREQADMPATPRTEEATAILANLNSQQNIQSASISTLSTKIGLSHFGIFASSSSQASQLTPEAKGTKRRRPWEL